METRSSLLALCEGNPALNPASFDMLAWASGINRRINCDMPRYDTPGMSLEYNGYDAS